MPDRPTDPAMPPGPFTVGKWLVEPQRNLIGDGASELHLEPKAMEVLLCLAARAGEVVPRQVVVDTVWATEYISDSTLTHAIAVLRKVLGDDPRAPRFIETIPKRGYRLVPEVEWDGPTPRRAAQASLPKAGGPLAVVAGVRVQLATAVSAAAVEHLLLCGSHEIPLSRPEVVFGRGVEADVQILAPEVSRRHARLELAEGRAVLSDLGSKNGTQVNDRTIDGPRALVTGDVLAVGPAGFVYRHLADEATRTREG
jgi:DNA-binding winged helix-turn-helix (wHTH) protein